MLALFLCAKKGARNDRADNSGNRKEFRLRIFCYVAELEEMTLEEAQKFEADHAAEIKQKKAELKEGGWLE